MLLFPRDYMEMCRRLFKSQVPMIIDHNPLASVAGEEPAGARGGRLAATADAYLKTFGVALEVPEDAATADGHLRTCGMPVEPSEDDAAFQVFAKDLCGSTWTIYVTADEDIASVKRKIALRTQLCAKDLRLTSGGRELEDGRILRDYRICSNTTLHVGLRLAGC